MSSGSIEEPIRAHHVYLVASIAIAVATVTIVALRAGDQMVRYIIDILRACGVACGVAYWIKRAEVRSDRRLEEIREEIGEYKAGYGDGYVDASIQRPPQPDRRLRPVQRSVD